MSDFTFKELLTGILKFNDENVMHIGFNSDTEDIIITNWNASADTAKTLQTNLNGGGGGGSFETGTYVGDGQAHSTYITIPVSRQCSNFIFLIDDITDHASGDFAGCWGTPSMFISAAWTGASSSGQISGDNRGIYLKFTSTNIQFMTAVAGGYKKLMLDVNYTWIAW